MDNTPDQPQNDFPNKDRWQGIFRGSIFSATIGKLVNYVGFADARAQGVVIINSVMIPIALTATQMPQFRYGAIIAVITGILSMAAAIISFYPKHYAPKGHGDKNLLHFSQIKDMSEDQYLELMREAATDPANFAEMAARDIYHLSKYVLAPKFLWLKASYFIFLAGAALAIIVIGWKAL